MGYYSEIAVRMNKKNFEHLQECLEGLKRGQISLEILKYVEGSKLTPEEIAKDLEYCMSEIVTDTNYGDYVDIFMSCVKWYSHNASVNIFEYYMRKGSDFYFLRVGEDSNDIEEEFFTGTYLFNTITTIERNY